MSSLGPLAAHIEGLLAFCDLSAKPRHTTIRILDTTDARVRYVAGESHGWRCPPEALRSPDEFAARFEELQRSGYSWINLSVYGILETVLIVGVELPRAPTGVPLGKTSVNYSGPSIHPETGELNWRAPVELGS